MYNKSFIEEKEIRLNKIVAKMAENNVDAILLSDNANLYYTSGRVYSGYTYITKDKEEIFFVKRPIGLKGQDVIYIRKPENIPEALTEKGIKFPKTIALELDVTPYNDILRLQKLFPDAAVVNGTAIMRAVRAVKTKYEIEKIKTSGAHHDMAYKHIPKIYRYGMTDIEFQIEIERQLRLEGSLGQFRISGQSMEIYMGNLLCGDNADNPTPYDFAMGGAGLSTSLPVGCNGSEIKRGNTVMVDLGGNFTGYMTDMTRTFYLGELSDLTQKAHETSIKICHEIQKMAKPGVEAKALYEKAMEIATEAGLEEYFMGHKQKAGFIGHGVGIEINEFPVLAPRSKHILEAGNVIAVEPKFVIPHAGAAGIENTYVVTENGLEQITNYPEEITQLFI